MVKGTGADASIVNQNGSRAAMRARLMNAATAMFVSRGFEATSVDALGAKLGVSGPALYYHFGSKAELLFECLHALLTEQNDRCRAAASSKSPPEQVAAFVSAHATFLLDQPVFEEEGHGDVFIGAGVLAKSLPEAQRELIHDLRHDHIRDVRDIIRAGIRTGDFRPVDPSAAAFAVIGVAANVTWVRSGGALSKIAVATLYGELAAAMLRSEGHLGG